MNRFTEITEKLLTLDDNDVDYVQYGFKKAQGEIDDFAKRVSERGISSSIEWGEEAVIAETTGSLFAMAVNAATREEDPPILHDALQSVAKYAAEQLIRNYVHSKSTSMFSNAVAAAKAEAYARFVREFAGPEIKELSL